MNKKAYIGTFTILMVVLAYCFVFGLILLSLTLDEKKGEESCQETCESYNAYFEDYESRGFSPEECWCRTKDNKPLRVT